MIAGYPNQVYPRHENLSRSRGCLDQSQGNNRTNLSEIMTYQAALREESGNMALDRVSDTADQILSADCSRCMFRPLRIVFHATTLLEI
jgi:hypothetical protein